MLSQKRGVTQDQDKAVVTTLCPPRCKAFKLWLRPAEISKSVSFRSTLSIDTEFSLINLGYEEKKERAQKICGPTIKATGKGLKFNQKYWPQADPPAPGLLTEIIIPGVIKQTNVSMTLRDSQQVFES